jgi:multiple antibiotic resistance protein
MNNSEIASIISFLVLLNPFALFIYLQPVMKELSKNDFLKVLSKATVISLVVYFFFLYAGEFIFAEVLHIYFEAFRIFGGIIFFTFAYMFIIQGKKSLITMKEDLDDLASEIALPFMAGAGTITLSILMGKKYLPLKGLVILVIIMALNFIIIVSLMYSRDALSEKIKIAFDKNMEIALRLNGLFTGAIGLNMIIVGINNLYFH